MLDQVVLQGKLIKFATQSTALGVTIDQNLTFKPQFEESTRKATKAWYCIQPILKFGLNTTCVMKLLQATVLPVWTYLAHIWSESSWFRNDSLWYRVLLEATASQYPHAEEKLEVICSIVPIDLQIETFQAKFAHKIFLRGDSCTTTLNISSSQLSCIMKRRHAKFCQDTGLQEYTPTH